MKSRRLWHLVVLLAVWTIAADRGSAMTTVYLNYNNFTARLNQLANNAGIPAFDADEQAAIRAGIESPIGEPFATLPPSVPALRIGGEAKRQNRSSRPG